MNEWMMLSDVAAAAAQSSSEITTAAAEQSAVGSGNGTLMLLLTVFALAVFVGAEIIAKIPPTLHTPLMSGSNAISGITLIGAILAGGNNGGTMATVLGVTAVALATINVVGGFVVTNRMLAMFKPRR